MYDLYLSLAECDMFYRVNRKSLDPDRTTLLFIHGLGESGSCWLGTFDSPYLKGFNLLVPDLPGCGHSQGAADGDYRFASQVRRLIALLDRHHLQNVVLVGHSAGGDLACLLAETPAPRILGVVNVEGNLTESDQFISNEAYRHRDKGAFNGWFRGFVKNVVQRFGDTPAIRGYKKSLGCCDPEAFRQTAREIIAHNQEPGVAGHRMGDRFADLDISKIYFLGENIEPPTLAFIEARRLPVQHFPGSGHWIMIDRPESFYEAVATSPRFSRSAPDRNRFSTVLPV